MKSRQFRIPGPAKIAQTETVSSLKYRLQVMNTVNKMPYHVGSEKINQPRNVPEPASNMISMGSPSSNATTSLL